MRCLRLLGLAVLAASCPLAAIAQRYPIMQPDGETRQEWILSSLSAPRAHIEPRLLAKPLGSTNLLGHLQYTPSERNQLDCGNCWSWAGTGVMEISLDALAGIRDRLSVQFLCACGGKPSCGCQGGWLQDVVTFYQGTPYAVPWANPGAHFQNGDGTCNNTCASIGTSPNYPITAISLEAIETTGVSSNTAIANIKNVLHQNKAIWFGFFLPRDTDWDTFFDFWDHKPETAIFDPAGSCGQTWNSGGGGHAVLCVGYNDDDPNPTNHYWLMLNSWGTAGGVRPNGLMRWRMHMDYGCQSSDRGSWDYNFYWQTLSVTWGTSSKPVAVTSNATDITSSSAVLRGMVNPKGLATTYWFQYGPTTSYGSNTTKRSAGSGSANSNVNESIAGLSAANTYHGRLVASNSAGITYGVDVAFDTGGGAAVAPDVVTKAAVSVTATSALLRATVNPRGSSTACCFEYGPTTVYGFTTATQQVGSTTTPLAVSAAIGGLSPSNLYHHRVKAWNTGGTNRGAGRAFSTRAPSSQLLFEDFEHGGFMPPGWTQEYQSPDYSGSYIDWISCYGDGYWYTDPPEPHSGSYNAFFYDEDYYAWTSLITPGINFGSGGGPATLRFWHYMAEDFWWGDQDELWIYFAHSLGGPWTLLAQYYDHLTEWTLQTVALPNPTGTCYIAFDGLGYWGYGVAIDDVEVMGQGGADPGACVSLVDCPAAGGMTIRWDASSGEVFRVDFTDNLMGGAWTEDASAGAMSPYDGETWYTNDLSAAPAGRYYRIRRVGP